MQKSITTTWKLVTECVLSHVTAPKVSDFPLKYDASRNFSKDPSNAMKTIIWRGEGRAG